MNKEWGKDEFFYLFLFSSFVNYSFVLIHFFILSRVKEGWMLQILAIKYSKGDRSMDMVVNAMRERARCISLIKEKYPGLPYYDLDTLPVLRLISRVLDNIPFDFDYHKIPRYSLEERMRAHRWERVCEANSYLSSVLGRDLDWMYEIGEAYYYAEHIDEFESCSAIFKGELHTFRCILSELEKENSDLFCFSNGKELIFECQREEIDSSDKWNPTMKKVVYEERVVPNNIKSFMEKIGWEKFKLHIHSDQYTEEDEKYNLENITRKLNEMINRSQNIKIEENNMITLPLTTSNGHFIVTIDDKNYILDTGSPVSYSFADKTSFVLFGDKHLTFLPFPLKGVKEEIEELVNMPVSGIIGLNTMKELKRMEISKEKGYIKFGGDSVSDSAGYSIPFEENNGVLTIGIKVNGKDTRVILDTGARIDYLDSSLLDTSNAVRHERDYNPILGHFEVDGYRITYGIGDQEIETITYGATDKLKNYVLSTGIRGVNGVVGLNAIFCVAKEFTIDYESKKCTFFK